MWNPSSFGRFQLIRPIGRGAWSDVYLAHDPRRNEDVALKLIRLSLVEADWLQAERRGLDLQRRLHPLVAAIPEVYESGEQEGCFYIAMQYVAGSDLAAALRQGAMPRSRALAIAIQLCQILEAIQDVAARLGGQLVVHGDIKPENIWLERSDRVRLLDFGAAKGLSQSRRFTANIFGSVPYLSPERLTEEIVDRHTDLWAVSVVLYQMIAGDLPFRGDSEDAVMRRIVSGRPPDPLPADCPAALKSILWKALAAARQDRYLHPGALRLDLEACAANRPVNAPALVSEPTRRTSRAADESGSRRGGAPPPPPAPPSIRRPPPRRPWRALLRWLAAAVLLLAGAEVYAYYAGHSVDAALTASAPPQLTPLFERIHLARRFDPLRLSSEEPQRNLIAALLKLPDQLLTEFRAGTAASPADWIVARERLRQARDLDDRDPEVQAKLAFCDGQISALAARRLSEQQSSGASATWRLALDRFLEAAATDSDMVEAQLAAAEIYGDERSGLFDVKKLDASLAAAERLGYRLGDREQEAMAAAQLSDARLQRDVALRTPGTAGTQGLYDVKDELARAREICSQMQHRSRPLCDDIASELLVVESELHSRQQY